MKHIYSIIFIFFLSAATLVTYGQVSQGGTPLSIQNPSMVKSALIVEKMPEIDLNRLMAEDLLNDQYKDVPWRFGENLYVSYNLNNSGTWDVLPKGDRLWRLGVQCQGAYSINLTFDNYLLPAGATLFVYNKDHSQVIGAFTSFNNQADRVFATTLVMGEEIILEYYEPANPAFHGELNLYRVTHGYRNAYDYAKNFGTSGSCENNVACPEADNWQDEVKSACMLVTGGSGFCSASLVNNTNEDGTPYILTANHCYSDPSSWVFWFNWQSPTCTNPSSSPPYNSLSGAVLKAKNSSSDFCLVEMNTTPPPDYGVFYAGWNREDVGGTSGACVHHPDGDIKKISYSDSPFTSDTWSGTPADSHWKVIWADGVTEGGSSGSPMFDQNHRIVGQLHGGPSSCTATDKWDFYGKFSMSWDYGTTPASRLQDWLDPSNTGGTTLDGFDPNAIFPIVNTIAATEVMSTSATLNGTVNPNGLLTDYHFEYGTNPLNLSLSTPVVPAGADTLTITVNEDITGLQNNKKYYFRLVAVYPAGTISGAMMNFTTPNIPALSVTPPNQVVPPPPDSTHFTVTSNTSWTVQSNAPWCTVTPAGTGDGTITATFTENTASEQRIASITVTAEGLTPQVVTVTQEANVPTLIVTPPTRNVTAPAGTTDFTVVSNIDWTVTSDVAWCTATLSGSGNGTIEVVFSENLIAVDRFAHLTVYGSAVGWHTVTVIQAGPEPTLSVTPPNRDVTAIGASTTFDIVTNSLWTAVSSASWCTVTPEGTGNGTLTATYEGNSTGAARTATILVGVANLPIQQVSVTQARSGVGVDEHGSNDLQIYPNPAHGIFRIINGSNEHGTLSVSVLDVAGVTVLKKQFTGDKELVVDLSSAPAGCYTVILKTESRSVVRKLVIIK